MNDKSDTDKHRLDAHSKLVEQIFEHFGIQGAAVDPDGLKRKGSMFRWNLDRKPFVAQPEFGEGAWHYNHCNISLDEELTGEQGLALGIAEEVSSANLLNPELFSALSKIAKLAGRVHSEQGAFLDVPWISMSSTESRKITECLTLKADYWCRAHLSSSLYGPFCSLSFAPFLDADRKIPPSCSEEILARFN